MTTAQRFLHYYKPYRKWLLMDLLCALTICGVDLAFPQFLRYFTGTVSKFTPEGILGFLKFFAPAVVLLYVLRAACRYYVTYYGHVMGAHMESEMRQDLFNQYLRLGFPYYDQNNTGEMMSRIVSDLFDISELAHHGPENLLICTIKIVGSFSLLVMINWRLTFILILFTLALVVFSMLQQKKMQAAFKDNRKKIAGVNADVQNSLAGIRVVQTFANEEMEEHKFDRANTEFLQSRIGSYHAMGTFHGGNTLFQGLLYACILIFGGYFMAKGTLDVAQLSIFGLYINIFVGPVEQLINFAESFHKGYAGFERFCEILNRQPDIQEAPDAQELGDVKGNIEYRDVTFHYDGGEDVLEHLNLKIEAGETLALAGPSGGGKTTLCSLLPRFYDLCGGAITIDGKDIRTLTLKSLREAIGIVQQDVYIFAGSIWDNIAYGDPNASEEAVIAAAKNANIHDFIMSLPDGYQTYVGERGTRLSGGQKQRIAIARVFLKNPPILILDEATSALDNESERYIQAALERLSQGRTTIVIAHRLSTIRGADQIAVIGEKGIEEQGTHEQLLSLNGLYARYYRMQFDV